MILLGMIGLALAQQAPPIVNGLGTTNYKAVGMFYGCSDQSGNNCWVCSGTLIHPEWVVTAAHCVEGMNPNGEHYFIVGYSWDQATDYQVIQTWYAHEQYNTQTLVNDIALLRLSGSIDSVPTMPVNTDFINNSWEGRSVTVVGYGITGSNLEDSGNKRVADMNIDEVYQEVVLLEDYSGQQNMCSGDSGGAALYDTGGGNFELVGINSFTVGNCETWESGVVPVDRYISWMENKGVPVNAGSSEPDPEPDSQPSSEPDSQPESQPSSEPDPDSADPENGEWEPPLNAEDYDLTNDETRPMLCSFGVDPSGNLALVGLVLAMLIGGRRRG